MGEKDFNKFFPDDAENLPTPIEETIVPDLPEIIRAPEWVSEREREDFEIDQRSIAPSIYRLVNYARKFKLPPEQIEAFTRRLMDKRLKLGDYHQVYYAMKSLSFGTPEEHQTIGHLALDKAIGEGNAGGFKLARELTKELFMGDEEEQQKRFKLIDKAEKKAERSQKEYRDIPEGYRVKLPLGATFADLYAALEAEKRYHPEEVEYRIVSELRKQYGTEIADQFTDSLSAESATKLEDVLQDSPQGIQALLPIKFIKRK